jgi:hypothetical protein
VRRLLLSVAAAAALLVPAAPAPAVVTIGNTDFYYAAAYQYLDAPAPGFQATFTVENPAQVRSSRRSTHHSLGQIGVGQRSDRSQLEAGWTRERGTPRLFVFRRPADGSGTCYNKCGFVKKGPGKKPGAKVEPGSTLTVGFQHVGKRWWLLVNGKRSGFYPDRLWKGRTFTGTDLSQVWGEVTVDHGKAPCVDMGNGTSPLAGPAAQITAVTWIGGPPTALAISSQTDAGLYDAVLTGADSMAYGGPGAC